VATATLYGANLEVKYAYIPGKVTAGHLYLGASIKPPPSDTRLMESAMEMLDVDNGSTTDLDASRDVGKVLQDLSDSNDVLVAKNNELRDDLNSVLARLETALATL